ncbi:2,3-bisphosphoglycerate-dependent phosphoglycerate mutase [Pseudoruegeria aquimaris]|uniref:2,3-bisphosphoglycerate-dependent phosphoglycerate mutase n=1 Tax=Pseudoruegeria aquimaris TaxID=393663 RepID=A0A1Y5SF69_9RHOB|nr:histidine phosphatase family protein [Pseudoruegeria aquimaris]SLN38173.1 2,3-bisphosphoglycerate-dependent phosphoglycerate mutase [Pseudoruegeria aquimaris]
MTLRLILTRHAKSAWDDPLADDHDRKLNDRGTRAATAIGAWLARQGYVPRQVISSSATRTRETWALIAEQLEAPPEASFTRRLYHAPALRMLSVLQEATAPCVLMLGHNPGIADFAEQILAEPVKDGAYFQYPTCATAVVDFTASSWAQVQTGTGELVDFIVPRRLTG